MEETSSNYKQMNTEISVALAPVPVAISENIQAGMSKNIVLDLG